MTFSDGNMTAPDGFKTADTRVFIQTSPSPASLYEYMGCLSLGESEQDLGSVEPIYCPGSRPGEFLIVDVKRGAPALPTADFTQRMSRFLTDVWLSIAQQGCSFNLAVKIFCDGRGEDWETWEGKIIYSVGFMNAMTTPAANPLTGDDNGEANLTGSLTYMNRIFLKQLLFEEQADTVILAEALDGFYYDSISCGYCSPASSGCSKRYTLTGANSGSPGLSSQIIVTTNDGSSYFGVDIPILGGASARRIAPMGKYLIGVANSPNGHFYQTFAGVDAASTNWTSVTSGYVASKQPQAIYVKSPSQAYLAGNGGYVYLLRNATSAPTVLTDGSLTTQNFNDIHGVGNIVVAVGASNALIYSINQGNTFTLRVGPAVGANLTAVWCITPYTWFVTTGAGAVYYTENQGTTWTLKSLPGGATTTINDVRFVDTNIGYIVAERAGAGVVFSTEDRGASWQEATADASRLKSPPTAQRFNAIATCGYNQLAVMGRKTVGGDGILAIGA